MTAAKLAAKYQVNVMKVGYGRKAKWVAFRGGNGTALPVADIAEAYHLAELEKRIAKALPAPGRPLIDVLTEDE